jgi:hypothetical protein
MAQGIAFKPKVEPKIELSKVLNKEQLDGLNRYTQGDFSKFIRETLDLGGKKEEVFHWASINKSRTNFIVINADQSTQEQGDLYFPDGTKNNGMVKIPGHDEIELGFELPIQNKKFTKTELIELGKQLTENVKGSFFSITEFNSEETGVQGQSITVYKPHPSFV